MVADGRCEMKRESCFGDQLSASSSVSRRMRTTYEEGGCEAETLSLRTLLALGRDMMEVIGDEWSFEV
jgi:hypothetical protein